MEVLRVENLKKVYGKGNTEVVALDNINFSVKKGEFISIIGASGSGKSTLLHLLGGVDTPTSGKVFIDGIDIYQLNDSRLAKCRREKIGLIYQFYNLLPTLNVVENISLPVELSGKRVPENEIKELVEMIGLVGREKHLPSELSGGQQQRVSIGRALINRPSIILADEPTGNLDTQNTKSIIKLLKECNQLNGQTIILITHDINIARIADRIIEIRDGKIIKDERKMK